MPGKYPGQQPRWRKKRQHPGKWNRRQTLLRHSLPPPPDPDPGIVMWSCVNSAMAVAPKPTACSSPAPAPAVPDEGRGHGTSGICVPTGIQTHETAVCPPPHQTHPGEGMSAKSPRAQSTEGKTFPNYSWPHTENHHAFHADGPNSHTTRPSKQCIIPPGTTTTVPIPNEHSSCVYRDVFLLTQGAIT